MRYFLSIIATVAWSLWLGGIVAMFLFINRLFESMKVDHRAVFDLVAPQQFTMAERYDLVIGALALVSTFALRVLSPSRSATALFVLLLLAGALAVCKPLFITPRMLALLQPGVPPPEEFKKLHGLSMMSGTLEAILLLAGGALIPRVLQGCLRMNPPE